MLEIHLNVIASDVGGHGNYWRTVELPDEVASRYSIQIRHDNVHQNHIVLDPFLDFVHGHQAIKLTRLTTSKLQFRDTHSRLSDAEKGL